MASFVGGATFGFLGSPETATSGSAGTSGTSGGTATADPNAPGTSSSSAVELLKTKTMTTLFTPAKKSSDSNTSPFSNGS